MKHKPLFALVLLLLLSSCGGSQSNSADSVIVVTDTSAAQTVSETVVTTTNIPAWSVQNEYIGTWECESMNWFRIIMSGSEMNYVEYYDNARTKLNALDTYSLTPDSNGGLIAFSGSSDEQKYALSLSDDGALSVQEISGKKKLLTFRRISDDTTVPILPEYPHVGMTVEQLRCSTWGQPKDISFGDKDSPVKIETWYYDIGYVVLVDGVVTTVKTY